VETRCHIIENKDTQGLAAISREKPWTIRAKHGRAILEIQSEMPHLVRRMKLEERVYRHRCVEAWSMRGCA